MYGKRIDLELIMVRDDGLGRSGELEERLGNGREWNLDLRRESKEDELSVFQTKIRQCL